MMNEIRRILEEKEIAIKELKRENKKRLYEQEEQFNEEIKRNHSVMKDQNELINSFESKIEKSLENEKRLEAKYLTQISDLTEV